MSGRRAVRPVAPLGVGCALALVAGAAAALLLPAWPHWWVFAVALALGLLLWGRASRGRMLGALLIGFGICGLHGAYSLSLRLPAALERADILVSGEVLNLPVHEEGRTRFEFRVDGDDAIAQALRGRLLRLSWYDEREAVDRRRFMLTPGSGWRFTVRLRAPRGLRNPGWSDSEKVAFSQRLSAVGYVRQTEPVQRLHPGQGVDHWRDRMADRIQTAVGGDSARFIRALAIGDTRALDDLDWEALRATGLTHLVAISGFHVGMVGGFFALLVTGVWWCVPRLGRRLPRPQAAAVAALLASCVYAAAAGWSLPTVRTVLMIAVVALARVLRQQLGVVDALGLAAIGVVLVDPLALLSAGFWLSFAGVAWLVWCLPDARSGPILHGLLQSQWVATIGLLPLSVMLFGQASLVGPLTNLLAIPWWSLVVVPLAVLGAGLEAVHADSGAWAWRLAAQAFDPSWALFDWLAASPLALWWLPEPHWLALPLALLGAFWMLMPRGVPMRWLGVLLWLPLLWPDRRLPEHGEVEVVVLDVGQGLSVLLRTAGHAVLYDTGPTAPHGYDAGERVVVPALQALGVRRLDAIIVSHGDADHAGGFFAVQRRYAAPVVFSPQWDRVPGASPCLEGSAWRMDGVVFRFLHPDVHFPDFRNPSSCVLRVESLHGAALLPGDIDAVIERLLLRRAPEAVVADLVIAAHHGSHGSSDPALVRASGAQVAVMSAGYGNRFGHPHQDVLTRWSSAGSMVVETADGGALRVRLQAGGLSVESERARRRRLWDAAALTE